MATDKSARSTTRRDLHRRQIRQSKPPCSICGQPIDYTLPFLHPGEYVVDHVIPIARGGLDTLENKAAAHRACNSRKSDKLKATPRPETIQTTRRW
ncbi:MAG: HNH endonuclease signature motif containing protein [Actinomycetota bacterium]